MEAYVPPVARAIAASGGKIDDLAKLLKITVPAIYMWKGTIPPKRAIQIEERTNGKVTRWELRPDHFGVKPQAAA